MKYVESEHTELKHKQSDSLPSDIVAFLNSSGGTIYIGVDGDGTITGVDDFDSMIKKIAGIVESQILPDCRELVSLGTSYEKGRYAVKIEVQPGNALFHVRGRSAVGRYQHLRSSCRAMTHDQLKMSKKNYPSYGADIAELPGRIASPLFHILKIMLDGKVSAASDAEFEQELQLRTSDGRYNLLSDLLSDRNNLSIKVIRLAGRTKDDGIIQQKEFGGRCLILAMQRAYEFCAEVLNETAVSFEGGERQDHPLFSRNAFRGAWFNACLHNSWAAGTPPEVYVYTDRLEIISKGGLPPILSKEDFLQGVSYLVNKGLAGIFMRLNLMSQAGFGVPFVVKNYGRDAYKFTDSSISVTIPFAWETGTGISGKISGKASVKGNTEISDKFGKIKQRPDTLSVQPDGKAMLNVTGTARKLQDYGKQFSCRQTSCTLR